MAQKARVLIDDPGKRFRKGEVGIVMENDFDKYHWMLDLASSAAQSSARARVFYFFEHEAELIPTDGE